jgi:hypothetical protein
MKLFRSLIVLSVAFAGVFAAVSPASAHNVLVSSTPTDGATVDAGVIAIDLTFEEAVMKTPDGAGTEISVMGPAEATPTEMTDGCVDTFNGSVISESVDIDLPGTYNVTWRTVSDDGHPIEGTFQFSVVNNNNYVATPVVACNARVATMTLGGTPKDASASGAKPETSPYLWGIDPLSGLLGGVALIAIISVFGALSIRARENRIAGEADLRRKKEQQK